MMSAGCLRLSVLSRREGQKEKAPGNIPINPRLSLNSQQVEISRLLAERQGVKGMKPLKYLFACFVVFCVTILIFALINHGTLCELTIKQGNKEVAARLSCSDR
ncbi:Hok/Gef family protein [Cronobacter turicensis]|uniref:Hok/Gef family protein n=1 Tax=Cronobacter turicensis TaxID=413502 RepID=UPI003CEC00F0